MSRFTMAFLLDDLSSTYSSIFQRLYKFWAMISFLRLVQRFFVSQNSALAVLIVLFA